MNTLLSVCYDGTAYHGSQVQQNGITVTEVLQNAIEAVYGQRLPIKGCSRTDAGVHANRYCANFHLWFLVGYASQLGFLPQNDHSPERNCFHIPTARFERQPTWADESWFSPFCSELLSDLLRLEIGEVLTRPLSSEKRNDFCRAMLRYLRYHTDSDFEIKSLDVLSQVLHP